MPSARAFSVVLSASNAIGRIYILIFIFLYLYLSVLTNETVAFV